MNLSDNTVLVTGGGSGIGLAIAKRFLDAGSQVTICGRRADKLAYARAVHPRLETRVANIADVTAREELIAWMIAEYPDFNVLVNNAGIHTHGVPADKFVDSVMARVTKGELEVGCGFSETAHRASREQLDERFAEFVASMK